MMRARRRLDSAFLGVALLVFAGCEGRPRVASVGTASSETPRTGPFVGVLDLSQGVPEEAPTGWLGLSSKSDSIEDVVEEADHLERDKAVRGVLVRLGAARIGLAAATEIGAVLQHLGRRMPVWCHADELGNATMYIADRGCQKVWASPAGSVDAIGIAAQLVYFHRLLADTLGLDVDFLQVGKYKGAEEPFTRDSPSPEARQSLESTLADLRASWLDGIQRARPAAAERAAEDGPYAPSDAKQQGLVDEIGYFDAARSALEKETGAVRAEVRLGPGSQANAGDDLGEVLRLFAGESMAEAPVAIVPAIGAISMEGGGIVGEGGGIAERRLRATLARLEKDDDVRAVVLRIDSPGGSALASDLLWHSLMRIRAIKPLVVSVGGMAASGGYYMASAGSVIFADETSIVGSIGVVGGKVAAERALERIGVHGDTVPAKTGDAHAGTRAAYESVLVPWDEPTRRRLLQTMTGIYDLFVARVAEGRHIPPERVTASAEGRIFGGREGKARGLVDELGGLEEAIARAREMAGLPANARAAVATSASGVLQSVFDDTQSRAKVPATIAPWATAIAPDLVQFVASVAPIADHEAALCALPFALSVR